MILVCDHDSETIAQDIADSTVKGGCAVCYGWLHNPPLREHYRTASERTREKMLAEKSRPNCVHLGNETGDIEPCVACGGNVRIKTLYCGTHGKCTLAKRLDGIACCVGCPEYQGS